VLAGTCLLQCDSSGYWSDNQPTCLPKGLLLITPQIITQSPRRSFQLKGYCDAPAEVDNGYYVCMPNPSNCATFAVGVQILYFCKLGYELDHSKPAPICLPGGVWSQRSPPQCKPVATTTLSPEMLRGSSPVTVVIVTSCSILGLLAVIIIVAIKRHRASPPIQSTQPPFATVYSSQHCLHGKDLEALIALAEGYRAYRGRLPTYEEAMLQPNFTGVCCNRRPDTVPLPTNTYITTHDNVAFGSSIGNISDGVATHSAETLSNDGTCATCQQWASNQSLALSHIAQASIKSSSSASLADLVQGNKDIDKIETLLQEESEDSGTNETILMDEIEDSDKNETQ